MKALLPMILMPYFKRVSTRPRSTAVATTRTTHCVIKQANHVNIVVATTTTTTTLLTYFFGRTRRRTSSACRTYIHTYIHACLTCTCTVHTTRNVHDVYTRVVRTVHSDCIASCVHAPPHTVRTAPHRTAAGCVGVRVRACVCVLYVYDVRPVRVYVCSETLDVRLFGRLFGRSLALDG